MRELLLQSENLLRERVDFSVLFVNLFSERFKLGGLSRFWRGALRGSSPKRERAYCADNASYLHRSEILPPAHLSDKRVRRAEPLFFEVLTNPLQRCIDSRRGAQLAFRTFARTFFHA